MAFRNPGGDTTSNDPADSLANAYTEGAANGGTITLTASGAALKLLDPSQVSDGWLYCGLTATPGTDGVQFGVGGSAIGNQANASSAFTRAANSSAGSTTQSSPRSWQTLATFWTGSASGLLDCYWRQVVVDISDTANPQSRLFLAMGRTADAAGLQHMHWFNTGEWEHSATATTSVPRNQWWRVIPIARSTGAVKGLIWDAAGHTNQTLSTEIPDWDLNFANGTLQWATGALATQRTMVIRPRTYAFVGASTITTAATVAIQGPPVAGTNATITTPLSLWVQAGNTELDGNLVLTQAAASSGSAAAILLTAGAHTAQTAATEVIDVNINLARTLQHATGALTTQRAFVIQAPTYSFVAASTITNAATLAITAAPTAGTNATITNSYALWIQAGRAQFDGNVEIGASGSSIGFFGTAVAVKQASAANLTNSVTIGGTTDTVNDIGAAPLDQEAALQTDTRNAIYQLARKLKQVNDALRLYGLLT